MTEAERDLLMLLALYHIKMPSGMIPEIKEAYDEVQAERAAVEATDNMAEVK